MNNFLLIFFYDNWLCCIVFCEDLFCFLFGVLLPSDLFTYWKTVKGYKCWSMLDTIEQWGATSIVSSPRTNYTHTCCRAFGIEEVITCFNYLGLYRPGTEPRSPAYEANALPLRNRGGYIVLLFICRKVYLILSGKCERFHSDKPAIL